jgi:hypothetical protein
MATRSAGPYTRRVTKKQLRVVRPQEQKLGRPTIMDRALAQRYGAPYVHLAAFAIDVDRVRELDPEDDTLPFGWEVWLTERYLEQLFETATRDPAPMIEDACLSVLELPRPRHGEPAPFGSQLPFAVYAGVTREKLPDTLAACFRTWKKPPRQLLEALAEADQREGLLSQLAQHCLRAPVEPPLVEPVRAALVAFEGAERAQ